MNERTLRRNIRKLLFEDNWVGYGTDDKSAGKFAIDADEPMETPISPSPQMAAQVSVDAPPVEDEEYKPVSSIDLAKAMYELFKNCPEDQLEFVYNNAHKLRGAAEDRSKHFKVAETEIDDTEVFDNPVRKSTSRPKKV
ncbi:MAG: hypothetical protein CBB97_07060 [Candidatus Endolissoclinum sp. TMED37]|nr:MAG: hypothetical protein CBB97_07060 [Candidatus Endolissoclinum sp. TMED37]